MHKEINLTDIVKLIDCFIAFGIDQCMVSLFLHITIAFGICDNREYFKVKSMTHLHFLLKDNTISYNSIRVSYLVYSNNIPT